MNRDIAYCSNCDKLFKFKNCQNIYRCGDTYVCSYICSQKRFRELRNLDPGFSYPHTWTLDKSSSTNSLFNLELASKPEKNPEKDHEKNDVDKDNTKNKTKDFDTIYENEENTPLIIKKVEMEPTPKVTNCDKVLRNRFRTLCARCFIIGVPSLCAICIIIAMRT